MSHSPGYRADQPIYWSPPRPDTNAPGEDRTVPKSDVQEFHGNQAKRSCAADGQHLRDVCRSYPVVPEPTGLPTSASSALRGRPPTRPFATAATRTARVRRSMVSRSSWAKAPMFVSVAFPIAPSACRPSVKLRNPMPRELSSSTTSRTSRVLRPSRSRFQTVKTSPLRRWSRQASSRGRETFEPLAPWSMNFLKRVEPKLRDLVHRANPCVPDNRHDPPPVSITRRSLGF